MRHMMTPKKTLHTKFMHNSKSLTWKGRKLIKWWWAFCPPFPTPPSRSPTTGFSRKATFVDGGAGQGCVHVKNWRGFSEATSSLWSPRGKRWRDPSVQCKIDSMWRHIPSSCTWQNKGKVFFCIWWCPGILKTTPDNIRNISKNFAFNWKHYWNRRSLHDSDWVHLIVSACKTCVSEIKWWKMEWGTSLFTVHEYTQYDPLHTQKAYVDFQRLL